MKTGAGPLITTIPKRFDDLRNITKGTLLKWSEDKNDVKRIIFEVIGEDAL